MRAAEVAASRILFWGGLLSILLMTLGLVGFAARGGLKPELAARPPDVFVSIAQVTQALARWPVEPLAIVSAGILLLLVTPLLGVVSVFVVFALAGDRRYAGVAAVLIAALLVSFLYLN